MEKLVSIIIPVYNVENYLKKCIDSVISQTYNFLDIILVDDGSTDLSGNICDYYATIDKRITVVHKRNGGLSSARNVGISLSKGHYIFFVDSDDWIDSNSIEKLLSYALKNNVEIVCSRTVVVSTNCQTSTKESFNGQLNTPILWNEYLSLIFKGFGHSACGKLFAKSLFKDVEFNLGEIDEDFSIIYKLLYKSKYITTIDYFGYFYYQRPNSITKTQTYSTSYDIFVINVFRCIDFLTMIGTDDQLLNYAKHFLIARCDMLLRKIAKSTNYKMFGSSINKFKKIIITNMPFILKDKCFSIKGKIAILMDVINIHWRRFH